jgi:AraC-like DNA-binding protein
MIRWVNPPKLAKLSKYIEAYWYLEKSSNVGTIERPKLNPDPSAHLILSLVNQPYQYNFQDKSFRGNGSHWLYPHCQTFELTHTQSFSCLGIKFKVGALYSLNNLHFSQALLGTVVEQNFDVLVDTNLVSENALLDLAKREPELCIGKLDVLLAPLMAKCHEDKHSEITRQIIPLLANESIKQLGEKLGCSQRTLERSFLKVTGLTLKQCQSIDKLEAILEYLYQRNKSEINWGDIAYQFGFSDQPHMIRYLKQHINLTPKNYAQQRGFTIDVYGGLVSK